MHLQELTKRFIEAQKNKNFAQMDNVAALSIEQLSIILRVLRNFKTVLSNMVLFDLDGPEYTLDHFGVCPECAESDGYLHVGRDEWFICHKHKVKWYVGSNLFSAWQHMTEEEFRENAELLKGYKDVEPLNRLLENKTQPSDDILF